MRPDLSYIWDEDDGGIDIVRHTTVGVVVHRIANGTLNWTEAVQQLDRAGIGREAAYDVICFGISIGK